MKQDKSKPLSQPMVEQRRRRLLTWTAPAVAAIALPAHAQTSPGNTMPSLITTVPSKCSGVPPVGEAVLNLNSNAANPMNPTVEVINIMINGASPSDSFVLPSLPVTVAATPGVEIQWSGGASDAVTCLPLSPITIDVTYVDPVTLLSQTITFDLTTVLSAAIP